MNQSKKENLSSERNKEPAYISDGFNSWKKAPKCFEEHQKTNCHIAAASMETIVPNCGDVAEMTNKNILDKKRKERKHLLDITRCLRFLARQGIAIQGNPGNDNFTQLLMLLGSKDPTITSLLDRTRLKYTHNDIQNELLDLMARHVLREKLTEIRQNHFFTIMADEYTDISNKEQLSLCLRTVSNDLEVQEDFFGFYQLNNIRSDTIVHAIKDILLRLNLSLQNCRGQTYDGASNMMGKTSGVVTQIQSLQPKAIITHCHGHSLSLAVKDLTSSCSVLSNTMGTAGEICILVKYSPKREKILGLLDEEVIEGEFDYTDKDKHTSLDKLCTTRWTVRAACFNKILEKYADLQKLWEICLGEKLDTDTRARIIGCQSQMQTFSFFLGLLLSHRLYSITDNLSKTLQKEKMSALSSQRLANLTIQTIQGMRKAEHFKLFFDLAKQKSKRYDVEDPILPRKRRKPKYSILQYVDGHEEASRDTEAFSPSTAEDHYRFIYFEAIDTVVMAVKERFEQASFKLFSSIEQLLLKAVNGESYQMEMDELKNYHDDIDVSALPAELEILKTICAGGEVSNFDDITKRIMMISKEERFLIGNVIVVIKIVMVGAATSATPERSFSLARRLKTWLRSTMSQKRFNSLAVLSTHQSQTDNLSLVAVANEFVDAKPNRLNVFGKFKDNDL